MGLLKVLQTSFANEDSVYMKRMAEEQSFYDYIRTRICLYVARLYGEDSIPPDLVQFSPAPSRHHTASEVLEHPRT